MKTKDRSRQIHIHLNPILMGVFVLILFLIGFFSLRQSEPAVQITSTALKSSLEQTSELVSTRYYYSGVGRFDENLQFYDWNIPFTGKHFLVTYQGIALLGIHADEIDVSIQGQEIHVTCPPIEVLSNTIDEESVEVYDESSNILNQIRLSDYLSFFKQEKDNAIERLKAQGGFEAAREDVRENIVLLLNMIDEIRQNYSIQVEFRPESAQTSQTGG